MKKFFKAIGIILLVLVILAVLAAAAVGITGAVIIDKATSTEQGAPVEFDFDETTDLQKIIGKTFLNKLTNSYAEITEGNINFILNDIVKNANIQNAEIDYINVALEEGGGTVCAALTPKTGYGIIDKTYPVRADFSLEYTEKILSLRFENIMVGSIAIDEEIFGYAQQYLFGKYLVLPEWVTVDGAAVNIVYDCSQLDSQAEALFIANIDNEGFIAKFGDYGRALKHVPTDRMYLVIDINLKDLKIENGAIVFNATIINVNELFYEGGAAAMDEFGVQLYI